MTNVTLSLDLTTPAGRAAMRAYLDAMEAQELKGFAEGYHRGRAIGFDDGFAAGFAGSPAAEANLPAFLRSPPPDKSDQVTGGEQPAGEEAETPPPAEVADEISSADSAAVKEIGRKLQDVVLYRNLHVVAALYVDEGGDDPNRSMSTEVADEFRPPRSPQPRARQRRLMWSRWPRTHGKSIPRTRTSAPCPSRSRSRSRRRRPRPST